MPEGQVLEFSGITKRFGAVSAVADLTATVEPGRVTGFLGPNGAGKTTSLRILLGLVRATSGTATIGGVPYASLTRPLQTVGAVLEASSFHPGRTAANHLKVYAQAAGLPAGRVDDTLGLVGLADVGGRKVGGFSLGMRQRLGLAYALLGDPGVLVLDEPANGLDPEGIRWMRGLLRQLAAEGRTVFVSSHLLAEVQQTVDSVLIISQGRIVYQGSLENLADPSEFATVVDSPDRAALAAALRSADASFETLRSGLTVRGLDAAAVGVIAASAGVALSFLQRRGPALEEVFLELVSGVRVHSSVAGGGSRATASGGADVVAPGGVAGDPSVADEIAGGSDAAPSRVDRSADEATAVSTGLGAEAASAPGAAAATGAAALAGAEPDDEAYRDDLPLDADPDVEGLGAIDDELSQSDLPADSQDPVTGDRPWQRYVKTDADLEADAFFASFTTGRTDAVDAGSAVPAAEPAAQAPTGAAASDGPGPIERSDGADAPESEPPADAPHDSPAGEPDHDTSELGTLADLSADWVEQDVGASSHDGEGSEQR